MSARVFNIPDVNFQAEFLDERDSFSFKIGMNATDNAPLDNAKKTKSGILKAAKYASVPNLLKSGELSNDVRSSPSRVEASEKPANKKAAEPIDKRLLVRRKIFAMYP